MVKIDVLLKELADIKDVRNLTKIIEICDSLILSCQIRVTSITEAELKYLQGEIAAYETIKKKINFSLSFNK